MLLHVTVHLDDSSTHANTMTFCSRSLALLPLALLSTAIAQTNPNLPPPPADPTVAALYSQVKELFTTASAPGYTDWPAAAQAWPCDVTELQVRRLASSLALGDGENDPLIEKAIKAGKRAAGIGTNSMKTTISDVRFAPLAGGCKDGTLEGPVEFVVEFTRTTAMSSVTMAQRYRDRTRAITNKGEAAIGQPQTRALLQLSSSTRYNDPATEAMMQKQPKVKSEQLIVQASQPLSRVVGHLAQISLATTTGMAPMWMTTLSQPIGPQSVESYMYWGAQPQMVTRVKNLLQHGEQRHFPFTMNGLPIPGKVQCFEEGEEIKTTQCDVK